jgi:uncharacterized protein (TIGR03435 family)
MQNQRGMTLVTGCLALIAVSYAVMAQSPAPAPALKFEVASVKASQSPMEMMRAGRGGSMGGLTFSGARVEIGSTALKNLVAAAYSTDIQHVTGPAWTLQAFFSIQAVMPEGATKEQYPEMMQALLAERFHLAAHKETSDQPAYALTLAKNGPKMKPAGEVDRSGCDQWRDMPAFPGAKTCNVVLQPDGDRTTVNINTDSRWGPQRTELSRRASVVEFYAITMPQLADYLAGTLKAGPGLAQAPLVPIVNHTDLQGKWHLTVERVFADAAMSPQDGPVQHMPITSSLIADELAAGISKMGLKLEKTTAPLEMIVIDHLDQAPTEN